MGEESGRGKESLTFIPRRPSTGRLDLTLLPGCYATPAGVELCVSKSLGPGPIELARAVPHRPFPAPPPLPELLVSCEEPIDLARGRQARMPCWVQAEQRVQAPALAAWEARRRPEETRRRPEVEETPGRGLRPLRAGEAAAPDLTVHTPLTGRCRSGRRILDFRDGLEPGDYTLQCGGAMALCDIEQAIVPEGLPVSLEPGAAWTGELTLETREPVAAGTPLLCRARREGWDEWLRWYPVGGGR